MNACDMMQPACEAMETIWGLGVVCPCRAKQPELRCPGTPFVQASPMSKQHQALVPSIISTVDFGDVFFKLVLLCAVCAGFEVHDAHALCQGSSVGQHL